MKCNVKIFAVGLLLLASQFAWAQVAVKLDDAMLQAYSVNEAVARYPAGSIQSEEVASAALETVTEARSNIEARFAVDQSVCYPKFFTTSCLNKAAERRRLDLLLVRPLEIEANAYTRRAKVEERDRRLAEKAAENAGKPLLNETPVQDNAAGMKAPGNEAVSSDAQRKARADAYAKKNAEHAEKQQRLKENEQADAEKRAANIKRYEEKVRESAARQKEIAEKKAEKERALLNK